MAALPEEAAADCSRRQRAAKRQKIIVVASLLDKVGSSPVLICNNL